MMKWFSRRGAANSSNEGGSSGDLETKNASLETKPISKNARDVSISNVVSPSGKVVESSAPTRASRLTGTSISSSPHHHHRMKLEPESKFRTMLGVPVSRAVNGPARASSLSPMPTETAAGSTASQSSAASGTTTNNSPTTTTAPKTNSNSNNAATAAAAARRVSSAPAPVDRKGENGHDSKRTVDDAVEKLREAARQRLLASQKSAASTAPATNEVRTAASGSGAATPRKAAIVSQGNEQPTGANAREGKGLSSYTATRSLRPAESSTDSGHPPIPLSPPRGTTGLSSTAKAAQQLEDMNSPGRSSARSGTGSQGFSAPFIPPLPLGSVQLSSTGQLMTGSSSKLSNSARSGRLSCDSPDARAANIVASANARVQAARDRLALKSADRSVASADEGDDEGLSSSVKAAAQQPVSVPEVRSGVARQQPRLTQPKSAASTSRPGAATAAAPTATALPTRKSATYSGASTGAAREEAQQPRTEDAPNAAPLSSSSSAASRLANAGKVAVAANASSDGASNPSSDRTSRRVLFGKGSAEDRGEAKTANGRQTTQKPEEPAKHEAASNSGERNSQKASNGARAAPQSTRNVTDQAVEKAPKLGSNEAPSSVSSEKHSNAPPSHTWEAPSAPGRSRAVEPLDSRLKDSSSVSSEEPSSRVGFLSISAVSTDASKALRSADDQMSSSGGSSHAVKTAHYAVPSEITLDMRDGLTSFIMKELEKRFPVSARDDRAHVTTHLVQYCRMHSVSPSLLRTSVVTPSGSKFETHDLSCVIDSPPSNAIPTASISTPPNSPSQLPCGRYCELNHTAEISPPIPPAAASIVESIASEIRNRWRRSSSTTLQSDPVHATAPITNGTVGTNWKSYDPAAALSSSYEFTARDIIETLLCIVDATQNLTPAKSGSSSAKESAGSGQDLTHTFAVSIALFERHFGSQRSSSSMSAMYSLSPSSPSILGKREQSIGDSELYPRSDAVNYHVGTSPNASYRSNSFVFSPMQEESSTMPPHRPVLPIAGFEKARKYKFHDPFDVNRSSYKEGSSAPPSSRTVAATATPHTGRSERTAPYDEIPEVEFHAYSHQSPQVSPTSPVDHLIPGQVEDTSVAPLTSLRLSYAGMRDADEVLVGSAHCSGRRSSSEFSTPSLLSNPDQPTTKRPSQLLIQRINNIVDKSRQMCHNKFEEEFIRCTAEQSSYVSDGDGNAAAGGSPAPTTRSVTPSTPSDGRRSNAASEYMCSIIIREILPNKQCVFYAVGCTTAHWDYLVAGPLAIPVNLDEYKRDAARMYRTTCTIRLMFPTTTSGFSDDQRGSYRSDQSATDNLSVRESREEYFRMSEPVTVRKCLLGVAMRVWSMYEPHIVSKMNGLYDPPVCHYHAKPFWSQWPHVTTASIGKSELSIPIVPVDWWQIAPTTADNMS